VKVPCHASADFATRAAQHIVRSLHSKLSAAKAVPARELSIYRS
jgi:hypothetical protein